jgi:predicted Zn-dependent protease
MSTPDYDMISRYIDGEMNAEEKKAFEELLQQDAALQKEVGLFRDVNETLKMKLHPDENEQALRNSLEELRGEYFKTRSKVIPFKPLRRWLAAAAALIIIAATTLILVPWKKDLYKQYAYIEMPPAAQRGAPADSLLQQATEDFNHKKFTESLSSFEAILRDDPQNSFIHYFYAIALLGSGQVERSRNELKQVYNGNSLFRYDAAFYMALSYLKEKDKAACKEWLNKIPVDADLYGKAQELLKKL